MNRIKLIYDALYDENARSYPVFNVIENTALLDDITGHDILEIVITNTIQTEFTLFLEELGATAWFQKAHKNFHSKTDRCPYCARPLQENFEEIVTKSFDDAYSKNLQKLQNFLTTYEDKVKELRELLSKPRKIHPSIKIKEYDDKLNALNALLDKNIRLIEQKLAEPIFILTHNAYFHLELTYSYVNYYEFVSFYMLKKLKNLSSVVLCVKSNHNEPSENVNYNPIKNSYAALWEEYKELKDVASAVPLLYIIRRILEYYFIQICGYDRNYIREMVFEENKDEYIRDENGRIDDHKYDVANAMLRYIASNSYEINDSSYFVDEAIDTEIYKQTFQMIFRFMKQE